MTSYNRHTLDTSQQLTDNYIMTSHNRHTPDTSIIDRQLNDVTALSYCDVKHY